MQSDKFRDVIGVFVILYIKTDNINLILVNYLILAKFTVYTSDKVQFIHKVKHHDYD